MRKTYSRVLSPVKNIRRLADSTIDFSNAVRQGLILGYYDAKHKFHRISREDDPQKIIMNAVTITLSAPGGTIIGPLYLVYRGSLYLIKGNKGRTKKGLDSNI